MTQFEGGKYPYALRIQAGEGYRKRIEMVRPAQQLAAGNSLFLVKGYNRVYALISNTVGLTINGETVYFREMGNNMDMPIPTKSAIVEVTNLGHDRDANIVIEQPVSLPAVVLGVMGSLEVGEE